MYLFRNCLQVQLIAIYYLFSSIMNITMNIDSERLKDADQLQDANLFLFTIATYDIFLGEVFTLQRSNK